MTKALDVPRTGALDFLALGALIHRLDPGVIPFRKATTCEIHVSGGEFNTAANLADCFGLRTGIATAMVEYPIGELIAGRVRSMGVTPFYRMFKHRRRAGCREPRPSVVRRVSVRQHALSLDVVERRVVHALLELDLVSAFGY